MREDNLLTVRQEPSLASHDPVRAVQIYLNLPRRMKLSGRNQLWIADITYIRLRTEFVYLAVILDGFSRMVVDWALERTLQAKLPLRALKMQLPIDSHRLDWFTTPIRACSMFAGITCKHSASIEWCQA